MNYALSTTRKLWSNTVAIPKSIVEQHLKFASARQLKALLYLLASDADALTSGELAAFLSCEEEELEDIMEYWIASGVVNPDKTTLCCEPERQETKAAEQPILRLKMAPPLTPSEPPHVTKVLDVPRLTPQDVVNRGREDCRVAGLLAEAQCVLCRTISHSEQEMLINMVDYYGLKPEVILMILAYAKGVDKANTRYILRLAKDWGDEGIDSVEQAEQKLEEISLCDNRWKTVCAIAELPSKTPTPKQQEFTKRWITQWSFSDEMIGRAFEIAKDNEIKKAFPYVNKILESWKDKSIATLSDLARSEETGEKKTVSGTFRKGRISTEASYNIQQIEEDSFAETLKFGG